MISEDWLEDLKRRVDLVSLGRRHEVRWVEKAGQPKACCPFHDEDTPSFVAYQTPKAGLPRFVCFGTCGRSWDAISFVMERTGGDFLDVVRELAASVGKSMPETRHSEELRRRHEEVKQRRKSVREALEAAQEYFVAALAAETADGERARAYAKRRGIEELVGPWAIGYAPPRGLEAWLRDRGFDGETLHEAYLVRKGKEGGTYEFFRDRLMLPQRDRMGKVIAWAGRALAADADPKVLNPGDIPGVYVKGETLFGLYEAQKAIREKCLAHVVEGPLDDAAMHLHGFPHTVATGGTAFTEAHARLLVGAGAKAAVLVYDGDNAGRKAAAKAIPLCLAVGLPVRVVELPGRMDPDELLRLAVADGWYSPWKAPEALAEREAA